jgi:hypothetical protein
MLGLGIYLICGFVMISFLMILVGEYISNRISPQSKFGKWWRTYICDEDPDDR